jgi:hypothetical protein
MDAVEPALLRELTLAAKEDSIGIAAERLKSVTSRSAASCAGGPGLT